MHEMCYPYTRGMVPMFGSHCLIDLYLALQKK